MFKFVLKKTISNRGSVGPFFVFLLRYFFANTRYSLGLLNKLILRKRPLIDVIKHAWLSYKLSVNTSDENTVYNPEQILTRSQLERDWLTTAIDFETNRKVTKLGFIIPVYRDTKLTVACLNCVLASEANIEIRVLVVNDCSPEPDMDNALSEMAAIDDRVQIVTNSTNLGFVKSVNR